jgi:glycosyltransferase involved in cell wall biosynthesis
MNFQEFRHRYEHVPVTCYPHEVNGKPVVTVCVQTYKHVNFIKECLDSILQQQTNFPIEILLGEDGSTDGTRELCIQYADKFRTIIKLFLHHRENNIQIDGTPSGRFNFVYNLFSASGKYVVMCDGDDYWLDPLKLQKQVDFLERHPDYSMCFHQAEVLRIDGTRFFYNDINENRTFLFKDLLEKNFIATASCMFTNSIDSIPEWFYSLPAGDWGLHLINSSKGKIFYMKDCMSVYRKHEGGIWSKLNKEQLLQKNIITLQILDKAFDYKYHHEFENVIEKKIDKMKAVKRTFNILRFFKAGIRRLLH